MYNISIISDIDSCRKIWQQTIPEENIFDLWDFRACFHKHFQRPLHFIALEKGNQIRGLLPLNWIEEKNYYGYFPGETWNTKTWLEQNRIPASDKKSLEAIFQYIRKEKINHHLRYLSPSSLAEIGEIDEIGYLFIPPQFNYDMESYFSRFSHKSAKRIKKEVDALAPKGPEFRFNSLDDFDLMVKWNLERFQDSSYFADSRFLNSFREMTSYLNRNNLLRLTTVLLEGEPAAIDIGCVFKNKYTLLGGGTNNKFPGVAKLINLHHMSWACKEKIDQVDFLCGDFSWKTLFHLTPRPLYLLSNISKTTL